MLRTCGSIASPAFRALHRTREAAYSLGLLSCYQAKVPVISIGNLVTGGSGKTPLVIWLASRLCFSKFKPAVVSRGYGGSSRRQYLLVSDGTGSGPLHDASVVGDEPYLIASRLPTVPVLIGRKRMHPIQAAQELFPIDVIVLDDGFQHLAVARNLDVAVLTGAEEVMLPFIQLREPLSALRRADLFFQSIEQVSPLDSLLTNNRPTFTYQYVPRGLIKSSLPFEVVDVTRLAKKNVTLVSAIARPKRFLQTARGLEWNVVAHIAYRDHHFFSVRELQELLHSHEDNELVFTEKDWVKLPPWFQNHSRTWALRIDVEVHEEEVFLELVSRRIARSVSRT